MVTPRDRSPRTSVELPQMEEDVGMNATEFAGSQAPRPGEGQIRRVTIQDLEGDCRHTTLMLVPNTLSEMRLEVCRRFGYRSERCRLYTRHGAALEHLFLIKDDELLFSTDGAEFPQIMREGHLPGLEALAQTKRTIVERYDVWGWPRVGQLIGAQNVSAKLLTSWRTNGSFASVLLGLNFIAFMFPPSPTGRGSCMADAEEAGHVEEKEMRTYFWCFGLGILTSMLSLLMATTLSMQLNLLPTNRDIFWFLKEYGNSLVGWPTTFLVVSIACTGGGVLVTGHMLYRMGNDAWILTGVVSALALLMWTLFLVMSTRSWRRVNVMDIRKVWPGDIWLEDGASQSGLHQMNSRGSIITTDLHAGHLGSPSLSLEDDKSVAAGGSTNALHVHSNLKT